MTKKLNYPSNQTIDAALRKIYEYQKNVRMPDTVRDSCVQITAILDLLLPHYLKYKIFLESFDVKGDAVADSMRRNWDSWPPGVRNKILTRNQEIRQKNLNQVKEMITFLEAQQKLMQDWTEETLTSVLAVQDEIEKSLAA